MKVHADILGYLEQIAPHFPPPGTVPTPELARALHRTLASKIGPARTVEMVRDFAVPGPRGDVACRLYSDRVVEPTPALIYLHGGGFIGGDLDTHDVLCRELAHGANCGVIAVDYCLAPEHRFPAPYEDCLAVCSHLLNHAREYGLDAARLAIGGDSAGGNLAAAVVQALRNQNGNQPAFQLLIYPLTDFRMATPAYAEMAPPAFTAAEAAWCADQYLSVPSDIRDIRASPALAEDLSGLPPAFLMTAEFDAMRDDGEAYALALAKAGVPVQLRRYLGTTHGFLSMPPGLGVTANALEDVCNALRGALLVDRE